MSEDGKQCVCYFDVFPTLHELSKFSAGRFTPGGAVLAVNASGKEFGQLMQGWKDVKVTNTLFAILRHNLPTNKTAAHIHMVEDFHPQKPDPHRIRITVRVSKISVEYDIGTPTSDLSTAKTIINSTLSTQGDWWAGFDLINLYLNTNLKDYENLRVHTSQIPE